MIGGFALGHADAFEAADTLQTDSYFPFIADDCRLMQITANYIFDYRFSKDFNTQFGIDNHGFQAPTGPSMQAAAALPPAPCATARGTAPSAARRSPRRTLC